jgi:hypothetical protein
MMFILIIHVVWSHFLSVVSLIVDLEGQYHDRNTWGREGQMDTIGVVFWKQWTQGSEPICAHIIFDDGNAGSSVFSWYR